MERRHILFLAALLAGQFILLTLQVRAPGRFVVVRDTLWKLTEPVAGGTARAVAGPAGLFQRFVALRRAEDENERLQRQLWDATVRNRQLEEAGRENQRLHALLQMREESGWDAVGAHVIGAFQGESQRILILDAGTLAGLEPGMPVVAPEGLVGRVWQAARRSAKVLCITDPASAVAVLFSRSRDQTNAIAVGGSSERLRVKYVTTLADVQVGDPIVTSGLDGFYPKGIPVGVVSRAEDRADLTKQIEASTAVPFPRIEEVLVIRRAPAPAEEDDGGR